MQDFVSDVEDLLEKLIDVPEGQDLAMVRNKVAGAIAGVREAVETRAVMVRDSARVGADTANVYVRENPWAAIGIAFGVGVLLAAVAGDRRS
jgi:ElaB/YqjD/DUF883 family membrane-anchored ribosome-binding protein